MLVLRFMLVMVIYGSGFWFLVSGFWFLVSGFWVLGSGFWVPGSGFRVPGSGFRVPGSGFWVLRHPMPDYRLRGNLMGLFSRDER
jgi:hypothetical protein